MMRQYESLPVPAPVSHEPHCYFLSDLHLLSRRSQASDFTDQVHDAARLAHTIVLGGDIFDFKWSTLSTLNESIHQGLVWLNELIGTHRHCTFHYLLGNHDAHPHFVAELDRLSFEASNLFWHPHVLRIGDCMFMHGDILDSSLSHEALDERRREFDDLPPPGRMSHLLYDVVVKTRLHRVAIHMTKRRLTILRKLTDYLVMLGHGPESGLRHVYFGHTHRDMDGIEHGGLTFHNGGASIKGLGFRIIEAKVEIEAARSFARQSATGKVRPHGDPK